MVTVYTRLVEIYMRSSHVPWWAIHADIHMYCKPDTSLSTRPQPFDIDRILARGDCLSQHAKDIKLVRDPQLFLKWTPLYPHPLSTSYTVRTTAVTIYPYNGIGRFLAWHLKGFRVSPLLVPPRNHYVRAYGFV